MIDAEKQLIKKQREALLADSHENDKTVSSWLPYFQKSADHAKFDSGFSKQRSRPDLQVWYSQELSPVCHVHFEARLKKKVQSRLHLLDAAREGLEKIRGLHTKHRDLPFALMVTDFEKTLVWFRESFVRAMGSKEQEFEVLTRPDIKLNATKAEEFCKSLKNFGDHIRNRAKENRLGQSSLNVDSLIAALLTQVAVFNNKQKEKAELVVGSQRKVSILFRQWLASGGNLTVSATKADSDKTGIGEEETFVELCFHSIITRMFALKWFLDHGVFGETEISQFRANKRDEQINWKNALSFGWASQIYPALTENMRSSNAYLWILSSVDDDVWKKIWQCFLDYDLSSARTDILGEFYQKYMQEYSKRTQFALGQFYTPKLLTRAMWKITEEALLERGRSISDANCLVVDPCVGTGTFLVQGLRLALNRTWSSDRQKNSDERIKECIERMTGFELNPLSKGIAVTNMLTEAAAHCRGGTANISSRLRIYETNTYDIVAAGSQEQFLPGILAEPDEDIADWIRDLQGARDAKQENQFRVVIGNPPWRNPSLVSKNKPLAKAFKENIIPFAYKYGGRTLADLGMTHGIREDYIFFFGIGLKLLAEQGLLVFVTSDTWLKSPSYTLFRQHLLENFNVRTVIKLGPVFPGVKSFASIVVVEKVRHLTDKTVGPIEFVDWSIGGEGQKWSHPFIADKLQGIIDEGIPKKFRKSITPVEPHFHIDSKKEEDIFAGITHTSSIKEFFTTSTAGVQSTLQPVFVARDQAIIRRRIKMLYGGNLSVLCDEIYNEVKGKQEKCVMLVNRVFNRIKEHKAKYTEKAFRPILMYVKAAAGHEATREAVCYFDPQSWHRPRVPREPADHFTFWDVHPKLVFRDVCAGKDGVGGFVDRKGRVIDNHFFSGGVQVVSVKDEKGNKTLSKLGLRFRKAFLNDEQMLDYLSFSLQAPQAIQWSTKNNHQSIPIILSADEAIMRHCASIASDMTENWTTRSASPKQIKVQKEKAEKAFRQLLASAKLNEEITFKEQLLHKAGKRIEVLSETVTPRDTKSKIK